MTGTDATIEAGAGTSTDDVAHVGAGLSFHTRIARLALALGGGALVALSMPPWGFWPLAFVGIALFDVTLGADPTRRERLLHGWLFGAGWMFFGMGWMIQLTGPGYVVAGAIFALFHAIAALVAPGGSWRVIGRPAAHTLVEALRFSFPFGGVPLASLGISQVGGPLAAVARIGGVILITWVVFQIAFAAKLSASRIPALGRAAAERLRSRGQPSRSGIVNTPVDQLVGHSTRDSTHIIATIGLLTALLVVFGSFVAPSGTTTGETLRIAAVQGGGEQGTTALDVASIVVTERHLAATAGIADDAELDLVFWPENTIDADNYAKSEVAPLIADQAARLGVPISVGLTEDVTIDGRRRFTNAQVVVDPDGTITSRYDKVRRVPFGEYVPLRSFIERITSAVDRVGEAVSGETPAFVDLPAGDRLAVVISWEVFFGGRAREGVEMGAEAVLNPTNGASYTGTIVQTQQIASSRLRAIETGRWVVQAAPTGFTAVVSPDGRVVERSSQREQIVLTHDVALRTGTTWYVELGDRPFIVALLVVLALVLWRSRRTSLRR